MLFCFDPSTLNFLFRSNFRGITSIFVLITKNKKYIESRWVSKTSGTPDQGSLDKVLVVGKLFQVHKNGQNIFSKWDRNFHRKQKKYSAFVWKRQINSIKYTYFLLFILILSVLKSFFAKPEKLKVSNSTYFEIVDLMKPLASHSILYFIHKSVSNM